jgi:hypothetical protein
MDGVAKIDMYSARLNEAYRGNEVVPCKNLPKRALQNTNRGVVFEGCGASELVHSMNQQNSDIPIHPCVGCNVF